MSNPVWPPELPQNQQNGLSVSLGSNVIAFQVGSGPEKRRPRSTKTVDAHVTPMDLTGAELEILQAFYRDTLMGGALPFDWTDFATGETQTFRFTSPPSFKLDVGASSEDDRWYSGTISLETV